MAAQFYTFTNNQIPHIEAFVQFHTDFGICSAEYHH